MKAEWDDAPEYLRRKNAGPSLAAILMTGCIVTAAALFIGSKFLPENEPAQAVQEEAEYVPRYDLDNPPGQSGPSPEEQFWSDRQKANEPKQTVFNDYNYTPKNPINVVSTQGLRESSAYQQRAQPERQTKQRSIETVHRTIKSWDSHTIYHRASWTFVNDRIDSNSVCSYYRRGSIDYRECRKGAKQHFHEECRRWREIKNESGSTQSERMMSRYCSAASSFSPMG